MTTDFHSHIDTTDQSTNVIWSDESCDYIFESASSAVVSCETASSSTLNTSKE